MKKFIQQFNEKISGVISCFDRMLFKGYLPLGWLRVMEPCQSFQVVPGEGRPGLVNAGRKCLCFYYDFIDCEFGLMHVRIQSWFPLVIPVCLNGHEWLARKLDKHGCVLRVETVINNPREFKVRRHGKRKDEVVLDWFPTAKGVANMPRYREVCLAANRRYLDDSDSSPPQRSPHTRRTSGMNNHKHARNVRSSEDERL